MNGEQTSGGLLVTFTKDSQTPPPLSTEEALVRAARKGDGRAFGDLVKAHLPMLFRIAMRITRDPQVAEDAVQETLTIVFQKLYRYEPNTSFRAFMASIATKRSHTLIRSEYRRKAREKKSAGKGVSTPTPLQINEAEQTAETIRVALSSMPTKRRVVTLLRIEAGLSYADIAFQVGGTEAAARALMHLALRDLKNALQQRDGLTNE